MGLQKKQRPWAAINATEEELLPSDLPEPFGLDSIPLSEDSRRNEKETL